MPTYDIDVQAVPARDYTDPKSGYRYCYTARFDPLIRLTVNGPVADEDEAYTMLAHLVLRVGDIESMYLMNYEKDLLNPIKNKLTYSVKTKGFLI